MPTKLLLLSSHCVTTACRKTLILEQVSLLMPAEHRLAFSMENTENGDLKSWVSWVRHLLAKLHPMSEAPHDDAAVADMEADGSELARVC